jgi:GNAT superfamily N-acetyltransferase
MSLLPQEWRTERLLIRDSHESETPLLFAVLHSCSHLAQFDPRFKLPDMPELRDLVRRRQTPHVERHIFQMQTIRSEEAGGRIAGLFHILHHKPRSGVVWLGMLAIASPFQQRGYGGEFIEGLAGELEKLGGYSAIHLETFKRNSAATLFMNRHKFSWVVEGTATSMILLRKLGAMPGPPSPSPSIPD